MNFSKKNHKLVGQNEDDVKKSQKHEVNLQKNSTLYFQVGLILTLLATYALFEMEFEITIPTEIEYTLEDEDPFTLDEIAIAEPPKPKQEKVITPKKQVFYKEPKVVPDTTPTKSETDPFLTEPPVTDTPPVNVGDVKVEKEPDPIPPTLLTVEQVPIYPGCDGLSNNKERLDCMSKKLTKLVSRKFDSDIVGDLGITKDQRIYVVFRIDKDGNIADIQARNPHSRLQKEAIKVANKIPQMEPAKQNNKNVEVMYTMPIKIKVKNN